ncbi:MAG: hypothetical protein ACJ8G4_21550, partial [Burkholderiales bacterium]
FKEVTMPKRARFLGVLAALALGVAFPATAQNSQQLVERYTELAGSTQNSTALVTGLRDGSVIKLTSGNTVTTIDLPTQKMGFGNVDNALALTQASLEKQGITNATPEQLKTALVGVLDLRAAGQGWGEIAHSLGFNLGEIKSAQNRSGRTERVQQARVERPERAEKPDRVERLERPMRPEKPERPQR